MADTLDPFLGRQLDDFHGVYAHVQRFIPAGVSETARDDLGQRNDFTFSDFGIRVQRLSASVEYAGVFCHQSRNGDYRASAGGWAHDDGSDARRRRGDGRNADAILRSARRGAAGADSVVDSASPGAGAKVRYEPAAERGGESAGESFRGAGDEVPAKLFAERSDGVVRRAGGSWRAGSVVAVGVGHQGRSIWSGSCGDSPGMVFHVHVSEFKA